MGENIEVSGSVEMYLATIAVLRADDQPVPLSLLAEKLSHSPVSVNEMCRKLAERDLVGYQPYKGVTLTTEGENLARHVLCRRQLWEVFLVDKMGITLEQAELIACELEHATPDYLTERLARFLGYPSMCPHNDPIWCGGWIGESHSGLALSQLSCGQQGRVVKVAADIGVSEFLCSQGVEPGVIIEVVAEAADGPLLLRASSGYLNLSRNLADRVEVAPIGAESAAEDLSLPSEMEAYEPM